MMLGKSICSKCGKKFVTKETRYNEKIYEIYRMKQCPECKDVVYTREHIAKDGLDFRKKWTYNSRSAQGWRDQKRELKRLMRVARSYSAKGVDENYEELKRRYEALVGLVGRELTDAEIDDMPNQETE